MHKAGVMPHVTVGQKDARQRMAAIRRLDMQVIQLLSHVRRCIEEIFRAVFAVYHCYGRRQALQGGILPGPHAVWLITTRLRISPILSNTQDKQVR